MDISNITAMFSLVTLSVLNKIDNYVICIYSYSIFQQFLELWSAMLTWLAYLVPSYAMTGLYAQSPNGSFDGFYIYLGNYFNIYNIKIFNINQHQNQNRKRLYQ